MTIQTLANNSDEGWMYERMLELRIAFPGYPYSEAAYSSIEAYELATGKDFWTTEG